MRSALKLLVAMGCLWNAAAQASPIFYTAQNDGGDQWTYHYEVENHTSLVIDFFALLFDDTLYQFDLVDLGLGLEIDPAHYSAPAGWFPETVVNDPFFPELAQFIFGPGDFTPTTTAVSGFSISFTWLGGAAGPGAQDFLFYDDQFNELADVTQLRDPGPVEIPEPGTALLLGIGLLAVLRRRVAQVSPSARAWIAGKEAA